VQRDLPEVVTDVWPVAIADLVVPESVKREWEVSEAGLARDIGSATGEEALMIARASKHAATNRRVTGVIKLQAMAALLEPEMAAGRKVISFAYHHDVIDALSARFKNQSVTLDGSTSPAKRIAAIKAFRESPRVHLFNGQISAAGEVIDLTPCSLMYIFEQDWVPKTMTQAIGRANRPGQVEPLMVWVLTLAGSIDDSLTRTLIRKAKDIETLEPAI
jgi:SNF2 family DNA or RNA helicase